MKQLDVSPTGKLVAAFVAIIVALVLISQVLSTGDGVTELTRSSETVSLSAAKYGAGAINNSIHFEPAFLNLTQTDGWRASITDCNVATVGSSVVVTNSTGTVFTPTTDYTVNSTGDIIFQNTNTVNGTIGNSTTLTYSTCPTGYTYGWAATMLNLVYGMFALAALAVSIGLFYSIAKDYGIA